jgi:SPP1 family predicted phage head-tail adaptor
VLVGELDRRLILERSADAPDGHGGVSRGWVLVAYVWARMEPVAAAAAHDAERPESVTDWRIVIRWRPDISAGLRFRVGSRFLRIDAVSDADSRRRLLVCRCRQVE